MLAVVKSVETSMDPSERPTNCSENSASANTVRFLALIGSPKSAAAIARHYMVHHTYDMDTNTHTRAPMVFG